MIWFWLALYMDLHAPTAPEVAITATTIAVGAAVGAAVAVVAHVRGNPAGIVRNLTGARALLDEARATGPAVNVAGIDLGELIGDIDARLADLADHPSGPTLGPPELRRSVT